MIFSYLNKKRNLCIISIIVTLMFVFATSPIYSFAKIFSCRASVNIERWYDASFNPDTSVFTNFLYSVYFVEFSKKDNCSAVEMSKTASANVAHIVSSKKANIILVIGESFNKHHSSLYQYKKITNPFLTKEKRKGNLFVFSNVIAPYNLTSLVLKNVFSTNSIMNNQQWFSKPVFPVIFKRAGYKVYFWDNQKSDAKADVFDFSLNSFLYNDEISKISYDYMNKHKFLYDDELITDFVKFGFSSNTNNLLIFHLLGQHSIAADRYPHKKEFCLFNVDSVHQASLNINEKKYVCHYDNATIYNDYVIKHIIDIFRNTNSVIVYFSDHGEEVYDYRHIFGRTHELKKNRNIMKYQYEIPFVIWCSNKYKAQNKDIIGMIEKSLNKPYMTDNVSHLLFILGHIHTQYYNSQCDLLSPQYKCKKRIVQDHYDYDKIISSK